MTVTHNQNDAAWHQAMSGTVPNEELAAIVIRWPEHTECPAAVRQAAQFLVDCKAAWHYGVALAEKIIRMRAAGLVTLSRTSYAPNPGPYRSKATKTAVLLILAAVALGGADDHAIDANGNPAVRHVE